MFFLRRPRLFLGIFLWTIILFGTPAAGDEGYKKFDALGNELGTDASSWAMVLDTATGLYWEVKSTDDSPHSNQAAFKFEEVDGNFLAKLNEGKFGGFSDWRLPSTGELSVLRQKDQEQPEIDKELFPNTMPSRYWSVGWCGSKAEWQAESVKFGGEKLKGMRYVRAVRGRPLDE